MRKITKRIGEILLEKGWITESQLLDALNEQKLRSTDSFVGKILMSQGAISEEKLSQALSEQFCLPLVQINLNEVNFELGKKLSSSLIVDHKFFPLSADDESVTIALMNPLDAAAINKVEQELAPLKVDFVLAGESQMMELVKQYRVYVNQSIQRLLRRDKPQGTP